MHIPTVMKTSIRAFAATVLALALLVPQIVGAGAPTDQLKSYVERVLKTAQAGRGSASERATIRKLADELFDWQEMAQRSLGPHWRERSPAERQEFVPLFADLVERGYISKIEQYDGEKIQYTGDRIEGDQATVRTKVITKQGTEIPIDYRMVLRNSRWKIYDVDIEGVSLVANYRTQFNSVVRRSSYQELVKRMKSKEQPAASPPGATKSKEPAASPPTR